MSGTLSEAERLLNTIVSSRVRLASLRGESPHPEPASDEPEGLQTAEPDPVVHHPNPATENDSSRVTESGPPDVEPAPVVLGMPVEADPEPSERLFADDLFEDFDPLNSAVVEAPHADDAVPPAPPDDGSDPFSFIDLIPSTSPEPPEADTPGDPAPPVRSAPSMPLPTALAAGAPVAVPVPAPTTEAAAPPEAMAAIDVIEPMHDYGLAAPRAVAPTVLDPDRDRLDVEVIEQEPTLEPWSEPADSRATPRLTEPAAQPARRVAAVGSGPDEAVFDAMSGAHDALRRGAAGEATRLLTDALDWDPDHLEARLLRGRCARDAGDRLAALSDFQWAMEIAPQSPLAHVEMGDLFFAKKRYAQAIQHYTNALERDPDHAMALCRRGICHHYKRQPDRALDDLRSAARIDPEIANIDRYIRMVSPRLTR
ncbi:MAG: tetratricopeptide repeat protein [Myxococcota bacterium]|nr:tetratricopeptide repeat protein [Myxococcota bacterium]